MKQRTKTRVGISAVVYGMVNAVLFGVGLILVLSVPMLTTNLWLSIAGVVLLSLILAVPISWLVAPYLRASNWSSRPPTPRPSDIHRG